MVLEGSIYHCSGNERKMWVGGRTDAAGGYRMEGFLGKMLESLVLRSMIAYVHDRPENLTCHHAVFFPLLGTN